MFVRIKFLLKIFLFILILAILWSLAGLFFFFSPPTDTIINFLPQDSLAYLHLSFNPLHFTGYQASRFFYKNWPARALESLFAENPSWQVLKYNFSKDFISYLQEFGFVLYESDNRVLPLFIYRLKPALSNLSLVLAGPRGVVYSYWLSSTLVVLSPEKINNLKFIGSSSIFADLKKRSSLFSQNFGRLYFNLPKAEVLGQEFFILKDFSEGNYFNLFLKNGKIFFKSQASKNSDQILTKNDKEFIKNIFLPVNDEYLLFYNKEALSPEIFQQLTKDLILPRFLRSFYPQIFIFSRSGFVFSTKRPNNFSLERLENILKNELSYLLPREAKVVLPDGSRAVEFLADPNVFQFEWQDFNQLRLAKISSLIRPDDFGLVYDKDFLFFGQGFKFLENFLKKYQNKIAFLPIRDCWQEKTDQALIYFSENKGLLLAVFRVVPSFKIYFLEGCVSLK